MKRGDDEAEREIRERRGQPGDGRKATRHKTDEQRRVQKREEGEQWRNREEGEKKSTTGRKPLIGSSHCFVPD